jgi:(R)-2-hydroxyacyl-CoA dehydratese activating ATPase
LNNSVNSAVIGLDIGSTYVKAVCVGQDCAITAKRLQKTGYDFSISVSSLLAGFKNKALPMGVTGYGRNQWPGVVNRTEISALAKAATFLGIRDGTVVDIGGQDSKILKIRNGKLAEHALNRPCAAGTGSYLEFIAHRIGLDGSRMNDIAKGENDFYPLNSFCTVFASTEILDCIKKNVPLPKLIRGLYAAIAERIRGISSLESPVFLSGGVIAYHPVLADVFSVILGPKIKVAVLPDPQFLVALGAALYAMEKAGNGASA